MSAADLPPPRPATGGGATPEQEAAVERMVRDFYRRGLEDPVLEPIFRGAIHDWEPHIRVVIDFWSGSIHGTGRYRGNAFAPHRKLRFEPEAFDHWLAALEGAARAHLAPEACARAVAVARHMASSYLAGLFPFQGPDGRPARLPPPPAPRPTTPARSDDPAGGR